jgi:hypothetical protein
MARLTWALPRIQVSIRTAKAVREKLSRLQFYEGTSASDYINKFHTWHRDLELINNGTEGYSAATKLEFFINNIKHPKYAMQVGYIKNIPDLDINIAIDKIRETEMELESARGEKRKMNVIQRRIYIEDGLTKKMTYPSMFQSHQVHVHGSADASTQTRSFQRMSSSKPPVASTSSMVRGRRSFNQMSLITRAITIAFSDV